MEGLELQLLTSNAALTRFERAAEIVLERQLGAVLERVNSERGRHFAFITNDEAMRLLGLSRATLARYRKDGTLAYHRLGGNVYYKVADIEAMLEARAVGAEPIEEL